ncbi:MAG TPA: VWA domain-containing protein [Candidatus Acidoferrales bacterium]|nr:VWA domain-containing protein [Candidatus Acidoferrales bacterium]
MRYTRYSRYSGTAADAVDMDELLSQLADFLLESGFHSQYYGFYEMDFERTMEQLRQAILQALEANQMLPAELHQEMERNPEQADELLNEFLQNLIERMAEEGHIRVDQPPPPAPQSGRVEEDLAAQQPRFELTDKALDFLGYKQLKELLGALGRASFGRHDTKELSTGVEVAGAPKTYEFGDHLNLDITATLSSSIKRRLAEDGGSPLFPLELDYPDLQVHQSEYQSSCATVVMLDCSHSMILYGEDRFTPAKKVALALSHLIRTQYPGDSLHLVLFHDSAEQLPMAKLARAQVGPYYTNTREGLRLARKLLSAENKDMRQIIMITDGKPSALTLEDGRIYKNAFGLDPLVVTETLKEVARCRRSGVLINTFMLASDYSLVNFVRQVCEIARGKAYFTTPHTLGQYLLLDYLNRRSKRIH